MLTFQEIEYFKNNKDAITPELLETLRSKGNKGKKIALQILDTEQDNEKFYLDAFGNRISYDGDRGLKKAYTVMKLSKIHEIELEKCANDIFYFINNYIQIQTKSGVTFPEQRDYQKELINILNKQENENIIITIGRQCIDEKTKVEINDETKTIEEFFNSKKSQKISDLKYTETVDFNGFISTDIGKVKIKAIHKTIPLEMFEIKTKSFSLICAKDHKIIDENYNEISAFNSLNCSIITKNGIEKIIYVKNLKTLKNCYDLELENHHLYFSNGILSHNSGKSVTTGEWLLHVFNFEKDINMGIIANKLSMAREYLDKVKKMFVLLPKWLQTGIVTWNKSSIEGESNVRILTDTPSDGSFRGYHVHYIIYDENAWITSEKYYESADSLVPAQSGLSKKKMILISTPNGKNHFYDVWVDASETLENSKNGFIRFTTDWRNIPRYKSDGTQYEPDEFKNYIVKKNGLQFWNQNYACDFLGSSSTLIPGKIISDFKIKEVEFLSSPGLQIYYEPEKDHKYIIGVDPAKEGQDFFAVQIFDITDLYFKQVACAQLQVDYLDMPEILKEWGEKYNHALIIIENNEGAGQSVADMLYKDYEYENLYFELDNQGKKRKKYPGFRTTKLSRDVILQTFKTFAQNSKLEICDKNTIKELYDFKLINNKYQAEPGKHDDLVMACALVFSIFLTSKNFEDMKEVIKSIKSENSEKADELLIFGSFDDFSDNEFYISENNKYRLQELNSF